MIRSSSALCCRASSSASNRCQSTSGRRSVRPSSSSSSRKYFVKINRSSEVDELLFAPAASQSNNNYLDKNILEKNDFSSSLINRSIECTPRHQVLRVVDQETVRNLPVQNKKPKEKSVILTQPQYKRLLDYSNFMRTNKFDKEKLDRTMKMESMERRLLFAQYAKNQFLKENKTISERSKFEASKQLIRKAWEDRVDNEDEVKQIANMIKIAKVQTIRDRQVEEKRVLKKLREDEEKRLNQLVEKESAASFARQQELDRIRLEKEYVAAHTMIDQMEENKQKKLKELDLLATENLEAKQEAERVINDNMMRRQAAIVKQRKNTEEFVIANKDLIERKLIRQMEEKLIDEKIRKIRLEKDEQERIKEEELLRKKMLRDSEFAKLRVVQEKIIDLQSQRDELLEKRANEETQRRWRERELKEEIKKRERDEEMQAIIAIQKHMKNVKNAAEAERERNDFMFNIQKEKSISEKDKMEDEMKQSKKHKYAKAIKDQMEQNRIQRIIDIYREKVESEQTAKYDESRRVRILEAKWRKLEESRLSGVSEKYLQHIENRLRNQVDNVGR